MKQKNKLTITRLMLSLIFIVVCAPFGESRVLADAPEGTIAYVKFGQQDGDEIHLVEPNGANDRVIYSSGQPLDKNLYAIGNLAWKPDTSELAFYSPQENSCSMYDTDLYTIRVDGSHYRRVSDPPACGDRAGLPTGTVVVPVVNDTDTNGPFWIYVEGAKGPVGITVTPYGGTAAVTFTNVADYGNRNQYAVWIFGIYRAPYPGAKVDVLPGATVTTGSLHIGQGFKNYGFFWPNYTPDGAKIVSILHPKFLYMVDSDNTTPGVSGNEYNGDMTNIASYLAWGPTPETANKFVYGGWMDSSNYVVKDTIMLGDLSKTSGEMLLETNPNNDGNKLLGLTWLPDGSGFLFSIAEWGEWQQYGIIYEYTFATKQLRRVTDFEVGYPRQLSISPDGNRIVYEYQPSGYWYDTDITTEVWTMNIDGSGRTRLAESARSPVWSRTSIPTLKPAPVLNSINPGSASAGRAGFSLTVSGSSFVNGSVVRWNGVNLATTYVNATTLSAQVPADKIVSAGTAAVTVYTPGPGGGESAAKIFTINSSVPTNPVPAPASLNPGVVDAGGPAFTLKVNGSNFVNGSVVRWNGANLLTTYGSAASLTASVTAAQIASTGPVSVTVLNPAPGGGESQALTLSVVNPEPALSSLNPGVVKAGGTTFTLTVNGSKFIHSSVVVWNGTDLPTRYVSPTRLTVEVTASLIESTGSASVTIYNPAPGGGESKPLTITISDTLHSVYLPITIR